MTVLVESNQSNQQYKNEIDAKIFKVLVAFSQNIEKSLINNQDILHQAENTLGNRINYQAQAIDSSQLDPSNIGLYTVQLVRNVIKRSNDLSEEFKLFVSEQLEKEKQYKNEIQYLKSRVDQLQKQQPVVSIQQQQQQQQQSSQQSSTVSTPPASEANNKIIEEKLENISLDDDSSSTATTSPNSSNIDIQNKKLSNVQQQSSSPGGSNLSVSSQHLDWDTKYQTELQLNAMLSEFLKDDFEISNSLGVSVDEVSSTSSPAISTTTTNGLGSSGSFSPSNTSPGLNHSNSSLSIENQNITPSQKKAMLTDLLDQIDLDNAGAANSPNNTPSKQKKGKFKFF
ncbi:hypothetical protein DICPUDRAFT_146619 [Dictyostelium purpureum]|uniref:Uncharacterized protein n=1 Tax=Dictyostelium purpureum TaxID=5786 RepID=F0Z6F8_DICPU|nr:uncharacterized protein DICPUDRAFT_146619 [Dictyostelium purpureum]EGC40482.1 hypothetical protein DICPUDRAFT_146619 [Dictyostelium purpureum]|eukprot:XP_003283029.1 hypothetical protein DICPUDRAFT_146619 [Dictyostelium purpureum]